MQSFNDLPPPPYSETDIYSQAGGYPTSGRPSASRPSAHASQQGDDTFSTSTGGDVIYTPPLTPQTSHSHPVEPSAAAGAYFDSRPAPDAVPAQPFEHIITVTAESTPENFPVATEFASRDVTEQDWRTFLNFLIPDHTARSNEAVADRKLRAEGSNASSASTRGDAEAQVSAIKSDGGSAGYSRQAVERTVEEWNVWFFSPRGVNIRLTPGPETTRMPGAWDQSFDAVAAGPSGTQPIPPQPQVQAAAGPSPTNPRGVSFGGIRVTEGGIYLGNSVVADRSGIRVGQFTADHSGVKYGGRNLFPGDYNPLQGSRGRGWNHGGPFGHPGQGGPWGPQNHPRGHHHGGPFGRGHPHVAAAPEKHSDTSESESESDSEDDRASIGSLPDYDELDGQQYAVYSQTLRDWLGRSGNNVSKQDIRQLKTQLRAVRSGHSDVASAQKREFAKEIKTLSRELKQAMRKQKLERKELKRQEKQRRRAEKRERREQKREMKRSRRDIARGRVPVPPIQPIPPVPPVPAAAPAPPAPHASPVIMDPMGFLGARGCGGGPGRGHGPRLPFGGGFGPGRGGGPWGMGGTRGGLFPGAWPDTHDQAVSEGRINGYNDAVQKLEKRIEAVETVLSKLEVDMAMGTHGRGWSAKKAESKKASLEKEIEVLQSTAEQFRLRADEEYARRLEAEENAA